MKRIDGWTKRMRWVNEDGWMNEKDGWMDEKDEWTKG